MNGRQQTGTDGYHCSTVQYKNSFGFIKWINSVSLYLSINIQYILSLSLIIHKHFHHFYFGQFFRGGYFTLEANFFKWYMAFLCFEWHNDKTWLSVIKPALIYLNRLIIHHSSFNFTLLLPHPFSGNYSCGHQGRLQYKEIIKSRYRCIPLLKSLGLTRVQTVLEIVSFAITALQIIGITALNLLL